MSYFICSFIFIIYFIFTVLLFMKMILYYFMLNVYGLHEVITLINRIFKIGILDTFFFINKPKVI